MQLVCKSCCFCVLETGDRGDLRRRASGFGKHGDGGSSQIMDMQPGDASHRASHFPLPLEMPRRLAALRARSNRNAATWLRQLHHSGRQGSEQLLSCRLRPHSTDAGAAKDYRDIPCFVTGKRGLNASLRTVARTFTGCYRALGITGASRHGGRRTAITNWAGRISTVGGSLREM